MRANNPHIKHNRTPYQRVLRFVVSLFAWVSVILLYYVGFSFLFDTPHEHKLRKANDKLQQEYEAMAERYDSLEMILDNITARDQGVFRILFESDPYDLESEQSEERLALQEKIISKPKRELSKDLEQRINELSKRTDKLEASWQKIKSLGDSLGEKSNNIPSIQPVLNKQLSLLTAGYGTILNPFYRTLKSHQGVDYTVGEGSSVFAVVVRRGQRVQRGDVIALSGNSGLSLAPHLHYEVSYNDMRINPIHYFFMELSPDEYQRIIRIAQSGMQSFD